MSWSILQSRLRFEPVPSRRCPDGITSPLLGVVLLFLAIGPGRSKIALAKVALPSAEIGHEGTPF